MYKYSIIDLSTTWKWVVASRLGRFTVKEIAPHTNWIGDWAGPSTGLDVIGYRTISQSYRIRTLDYEAGHTVASHYTDCIILVIKIKINHI
jgi:hypothetical protein